MTLARKMSVPRKPWRVCLSQCEGVYAGNEHFAIIEDADCGLIIADIEEWLERLAPFRADYRHHRTRETHGDAHLKNLLVGHQVLAP